MTMTTLRKFALAALAAPLALGLAGCGDAGTDDTAAAEAIAPIAAPAGTAWTDVVKVSEDGGYVLGNPDAPIKLVEYGSLTCPACAAFATNGAAQLKENYVSSGRVSYEFRSMILHGAPDLVLTGLVTCGAPEAVHPLSDQVWSNLNPLLDRMQASGPALEQALQMPENQRFAAFAEQSGFLDFFAARGLSKDQARQCLADFPAMEKIAENSAKNADRDNIRGTPTFLLNGSIVDGNSWSQLEPALQRAGAR